MADMKEVIKKATQKVAFRAGAADMQPNVFNLMSELQKRGVNVPDSNGQR